MSFELLVTWNAVTASICPGLAVVVVAAPVTVTTTLRSTVTALVPVWAVWLMPPTVKLTVTVLVMVWPATVPAA